MDDIQQDPKCDREIAVYGYLRGTKLKSNARVHIAGVGDATVSASLCMLHSNTCASLQLCAPRNEHPYNCGSLQ